MKKTSTTHSRVDLNHIYTQIGDKPGVKRLFALALEQAKKRREGSMHKAIEAAFLAGEAAAAASILSNYMGVPTNNEQAVG